VSVILFVTYRFHFNGKILEITKLVLISKAINCDLKEVKFFHHQRNQIMRNLFPGIRYKKFSQNEISFEKINM
jgi:hypothetical protein